MASISRRGDVWRARFRGPDGRERARHFARKVDARRWLDEQAASVVTGQWVDPKAGQITFSSYFDQWAKRQVWVSGTDRAVRLAVDSVTFGDVPLGSLRRSHVESWVKAMQTKDRGEGRQAGLSPGTVRTRFNNVRSVLRAAVRDRLIAGDPSYGVTLPRVRRADVAMVLPTIEQVRALLADESDFRAFVAVCAFAGLRLGEAAALKVGDVDFLRRTLAVSRQVQRANGGTVEIRPPKYGSERTVYLADELVRILSRHVELYRPGDDPSRWIFPGEGGNPWHQNTVGHHWRQTKKAAGVDGVKLHDLRHFFASGLIAEGCDVVTVQRALGHSNATVTLRTYAHLWPSAEDRTRKAAASMLSATLSLADSERTGEG
jgi:integrase